MRCGWPLPRHPERLDLRTVFVDAMLNQTPWQMWDLASGSPPTAPIRRRRSGVLEEALGGRSAGWSHPGLLHLYVHLMEMSPFPERALKAGDVLRDPGARRRAPGAHAHPYRRACAGTITTWCVWNRRRDPRPISSSYARDGAINIYTGYRQHNYHFAIYGAMFLGQFAPGHGGGTRHGRDDARRDAAHRIAADGGLL